MAMVISIPKTFVLVFNLAFPGPYQWTINGAALQIVSQVKYLGLLSHTEAAFTPSFVDLKQKMYGAWALLQRQYGRLQCLSSVGLLARIYMVCVPPTASYGCEVWGHYKLHSATAASREALAKSHLHILRQISGVRSSTAVSILLAEFGLMPLQDQWLLRAATFWNAIVALPPTSLYKKMALDACTWAACVSKAVRGTGYDFSIRQGALAHIDLQVLSSHLRQRRDAVWDNLDICPRTCPTEKSRLCTYKNWFARPAGRHARSLLDLPLSRRCMQRMLRFRMGCHKLPKDTGCWLRVPRQNRVCTMCQQGVLGDEKHLLFECPALQDLRDRYENLFQAPQGDAMLLFMWQDDIIGVARFIDACLERMSTSAGPPVGDQASDQP